MDYATIARELAPALSTYLHDYEGSRDLGRGTAFPTAGLGGGAIQAGDRFFRTDLGFACYYDGTRWLTTDILTAQFANLTYSATADDFATLFPIAADYAPFLVRWDAWVSVGGTNNGSNYWTILLRDTASNTAASFNTSGQTASTQLLYVLVSFTQPTVRQYLNVRTEKTAGAPSNVSMFSSVRYRLIIP